LENVNSICAATKDSIPADKFSGNEALVIGSAKQTHKSIGGINIHNVQYNAKKSTHIHIDKLPKLLDNEIQDLSDKMLQSDNTKSSKTLAAHQSDQNLIEDRLDNMEIAVEVELISVKPAPTTTSNEVIQLVATYRRAILGKQKLPPTHNLESGMPPAAKQCQNDNSSNKNAMLNQRDFSNVTAMKLKTVVQKHSYNVVVPQPKSGTIAGNFPARKMTITHDQIFNLVTHCLDEAEIAKNHLAILHAISLNPELGIFRPTPIIWLIMYCMIHLRMRQQHLVTG